MRFRRVIPVVPCCLVAWVVWLAVPAAKSQPAVVARENARMALDPATPIYVGAFATGHNASVIKFSRTFKGRYFSFDTFSAHDNRPFAAVAELELLDQQGQPVDRSAWRVLYADSEEFVRENGSATNVIDGNPDTHWHTEWGAEMQNHPHRLIVDLGEVRSVTGLRYLPRQGPPGVGGRIKDFSVGLSENLKVEQPVVDLLPDNCYLFAYFVGDRDGLRLAWSMDGFRWDVINRGRSVLRPAPNHLLRDPFLGQGPDGTYHLLWTLNWRGNAIGHAQSLDLIHWSAVQEIPVMTNEPAVLNCWAPEFFYDGERKEFIIFWTSAVSNQFGETLGRSGELANQRLFATTTKDFERFTTTRLFCDPGFSVIDATMIARGGEYHLFFKDESDEPAAKNIRSVSGPSPQGPFGAATPAFTPGGVEGPSIFQVGAEYVIYFRYNNSPNRWSVMKSADLRDWEAVNERFALPEAGGARQGAVLTVPRKLILDLWRENLLDLGPTPAATQLRVGNWIWTTNVADKQTCRLWHSFQVPADTLVSRATLRLTADNGYRLFLDGREIGRGGDYNSLTEFDLTPLVTPGLHVIGIEAFNDAGNAGVILGLQVELSNGRNFSVVSDPSWLVVPRDESRWESRRQPGDSWWPARVVAFAGRQIWARPERIIPAPPLQPVHIRFWQQGWFLTGLLLVCGLVAGVSVWLGLQLAVQARSSRLLERERARIARDIHDDLGAGLTQLTLEGELILRDALRGTKTHQQVDALCNRGRALLGSLDEVVWAVNPRRDTVQDFVVFICEHAQSYLGPTAIRCRLDVPEDLPPAPMDLPARRNLLLAVKEAVRNAARHSGADEITLGVRVADGQLTVAITDNGRGFDPEATGQARHGLRNMRARLADVGGACEVMAAAGGGCRVTFRAPLVNPQLQGNHLFRAIRTWISQRKRPETTS